MSIKVNQEQRYANGDQKLIFLHLILPQLTSQCFKHLAILIQTLNVE